ncbi:hypothetical protein ACN42_g11429 [Penicillium freii]|uniref:Uncharacterized protein n=1 Tax=Penicillium freii TaxID=48697 RepID=A0A117NK99_PENFR|nr:hypothetical protein ACN42_g11429 [Penicillium freii]
MLIDPDNNRYVDSLFKKPKADSVEWFSLIDPYSRPSFIQLVRWPSWSKAHGSGPPDPDGTQLSPCLERGVGSNPTLIISFCFLLLGLP